MSTPAVDPHIRPSGSFPHSLIIVGVGLGRGAVAGSTTTGTKNCGSLAPDCARSQPADITITATPTRDLTLNRCDSDMLTPPSKRNVSLHPPAVRSSAFVLLI